MGNLTNQIVELNSNPLLSYKLIPKKHPFSHLLSESLRIWGEDAHRFEISLEVKVQIENVMLLSFLFFNVLFRSARSNAMSASLRYS